VEWARERRGWIFLTTLPQYRDPLRPLVSLWLDLLVLRLMNDAAVVGMARPTWFVLDELASLQRLPQLHTAMTENRKSGNPVVLGFQGRSQMETRYGHDAEAMLSQPIVKVFFRTSEPHSAEWISRTIGEVEIERLRESRNHDEFPRQRATRGLQLERRIEPLVMSSQIQGLQELHGYLKCGNQVVQLSVFRAPSLPKAHEGFIPRKDRPVLPPEDLLALPSGSRFIE
jgi:type IV secretory pathway TraG/TraD family ATPase VirD4